MKYIISDEIIKGTKRCDFEFSCVNTGKCGDKTVCEVEGVDGENILFLNSKDCRVCSYQTSFGRGVICGCPTHYAIVAKYGQKRHET